MTTVRRVVATAKSEILTKSRGCGPDGYPQLEATMWKHFSVSALVGLCLLSVSATAFAQSSTNASAKAAAQINTVTGCAQTTTGTPPVLGPCKNPSGDAAWLDLMSQQVKVSNSQALFVNASLVTALFTETQVKGSTTGSTTTGSSSVASGTVAVRVLIDGDVSGTGVYPAAPDTNGESVGVIFDQRIQTLNATIGGVFTGCTVLPCTVTTTEQITLILDTSGAHSFSWILPSVGVGYHTIKVQVCLATGTTGTTPGNASVAEAMFGLGSLTIESVRLNNALITF